MNLWTDFDNTHQPSLHAVARTGRLTEHSIVSSLRQWLLNDYVAPYCRSLAATRIFRRCYWIDALGSDAKGNDSVEGTDEVSKASNSRNRKKSIIQDVPSALLPLVSLSQALAQESKPIALYGFSLRTGRGKRGEGKAGQDVASAPARRLVIPKESGIVSASWQDIAPRLLTEIDSSPAIFLLHPFGPTLFRYEDLAPLYSRAVPTEMLLFISHKQIIARLLAAQRAPTSAVALTDLLRSDHWKRLAVKEEEKEATVTELLNMFVSSMQRSFSLPVQRIRLPVQVRPTVLEELPYTLLFATRRQDSFVSMNDAVCLYHRRVLEESYRGVLAEDWFAAQQQKRFEEQREQLCQRTLQQGRAQRIRRWPDLRQQLLIPNFGQYMQHEYNVVIQQLLSQGEVRCEWRLRTIEERVPGNDDTLMWT
jgi:hypothetical protein